MQKKPNAHLRKYRAVFGDDVQWNYLLHDSLADFNQFVNNELSVLSAKNRKEFEATVTESQAYIKDPSSTWFGTPRPASLNELKNHKEFIDKPLMKKVEELIKGRLKEFEQLSNQDLVKKKKIAYNARGFGIFSFDRAAMGLYQEYYSSSLQKTVPEREVEHRPGQQPEYVLRADGSEIKRKIRTSVKDVYAYFEPKDIEQKSYKIYLLSGAHAHVSGQDMLYTGMGACVLADYLSQQGYGVEINLIIGTLNKNEKGFFSIVRLKRFDDYLDKNVLAVLSSDPRFFRYNGFNAIVANYNTFGADCPASLGHFPHENAIRRFVAAIEDQQNTDVKPIVFGRTYELADITNQIIATLNRIEQDNAPQIQTIRP